MYATSADLVCGRHGSGYFIKDATHGRGLFAARRFAAGAVIARFTGDMLHAATLPASRPATHMLRLPGTDAIIDGRRLSRALVRVPNSADGEWVPPPNANPDEGYACMANASGSKITATAMVAFLVDDTGKGVRPQGYDPARPRPLCRVAQRVLPQAAYLIARRDLRAGEEIKWFYQVALK